MPFMCPSQLQLQHVLLFLSSEGKAIDRTISQQQSQSAPSQSHLWAPFQTAALTSMRLPELLTMAPSLSFNAIGGCPVGGAPGASALKFDCQCNPWGCLLLGELQLLTLQGMPP